MIDDFFKYCYAWEKFHSAVLSLAGEGSIQQRLENAYVFNIINLWCDNDIPEELHEEFGEIVALMTASDAAEGRVNAMDETLRSSLVKKIISLYDRLCRYMPKHY